MTITVVAVEGCCHSFSVVQQSNSELLTVVVSVSQTVRHTPDFMKPAADSHPEPDKSNVQSHNLFI